MHLNVDACEVSTSAVLKTKYKDLITTTTTELYVDLTSRQCVGTLDFNLKKRCTTSNDDTCSRFMQINT